MHFMQWLFVSRINIFFFILSFPLLCNQPKSESQIDLMPHITMKINETRVAHSRKLNRLSVCIRGVIVDDS